MLNRLRLNKSEFYLIVRNPYKRLESFFKDKFRQTISQNEEKGEWQNCHKIFFPHLGLEESFSASIIAKKLLSVTFSEFILLLPLTFQNDGHLFPQHWAKTINIRNLKIPVKYDMVFKIESEKDLENMSKLFKINLCIRANSTKLVQETITWTQRECTIVETIYKDDFKKFNYEKMTVANKVLS